MTSAPENVGRVAAVVPTLDRMKDLAKCLDAVAAQTRRPDATFVVVDGPPTGDTSAIPERPGLRLLTTGERVGAPGAFAHGIVEALESGADWLWLLDDDCVPGPDALRESLAVVATDDRAAGAAPTVVFGDGRREAGWHWGSRAADGHGQSPNHDAGEIDWAPFAGLLLRRGACEAVGAIRSDFVLWHADVEYCLRLRCAGWRLLAAPAAEVLHPAMPMIERRVLGRRIRVGRIAPWREYYDTRNLTLLRRKLRDTPVDDRVPLRVLVADEFKRDAAVMLADPAGLRRVGMRALGRLDGLRGHLARHPETKRPK
jgi:rhamnopyranosyl-N-acetylglucosaminyl-diphospho-decaprenol beta-1,3/1,4-galactofuranosyltransferase